MAGVGLGIYGTVDTPDQDGLLVLDGGLLHNDSWGQHAYLVASGTNVPTFRGNANLVATDIDAAARMGLADVTVVNGSGSVQAAVNFSLKDPGSGADQDGKIRLTELLDNLSNVDAFIRTSPDQIATGSLNLSLPIAATLPWTTVNASPGVTVNWPNVYSPISLATTYDPALSSLLDVRKLDTDDIYAALSKLTDYLSQMEGYAFLKEKLPILNRSLSDMLSVSNKYQEFLDQYKRSPGQSLADVEESLETALESSLGLPTSSGTDADSVELSFDGAATKRALKIELNLAAHFVEQLGVDLDLKRLNLKSVSSLVDINGSGKLDVSAHALLNLDIGIDLSNPTTPKPFLYNSTTTSLEATVNGANLSFSAAVGPIGISIGNGTDNNGSVSLGNGTGPANFRHRFEEL